MRIGAFFKWICLAMVGFCINAAYGVERFPPPEFEEAYKMPVPALPAPRLQSLEWLDVFVLFVALVLSTYFVLKKRSRRWVLGLGIFSLLYFGFYRKGCICAIGSIQDVALGLSNSGYSVPIAVLAFFLLPIIFALFFGRSFCGAVCPQGAIQDLFLLKPIHLWPWLERTLRMIPPIYLGAAVLFAATGSAFIICEYDPFVALFRRSGTTGMLILGVLFLVVGAFIGRPYCRFFCPYGALLGWVSRFSKWKVTLSPNDCLQCAICDTACPYGAIATPAHPTPKTHKGPLAFAIILIPILVALGFWLGNRIAIPLSKVHPTVALAERVVAEDTGKVKGTTDASTAFRATGKTVDQLTTQALKAREDITWGSELFGAFVGLVFGLRFLSLALSRPNKNYDPDPANCVSCARCYNFCPRELTRVRKLGRKPMTTAPTPPAPATAPPGVNSPSNKPV